ncbi:hypothetical protein DL93DRAFT_528549 [Clavulina sp. PMI_390]|nr:hypothetical protein DL93DRAFT_528549 [Clavulina sp. PMI_390]
MPPSRTQKSKTSHEPQNRLPGVQKLKSAIRQATRLLAKEKLGANIRVETERRLKALEADLAQAQQNKVEKTNASRYHMVKFFERQKAIRKIKKTNRALSDDSLDPKARRKLEKTLFSQRVDLNYILNFPNTRKYVSLYPAQSATEGIEDPAAPSTSTSISAETDATREEIRKWVKDSMKTGAMEAEPENNLAKHTAGDAPAAVDEDGDEDEDEGEEASEDGKASSLPSKGDKKSKLKSKSKDKDKTRKSKGSKHNAGNASEPNLTVENDDFFE